MNSAQLLTHLYPGKHGWIKPLAKGFDARKKELKDSSGVSFKVFVSNTNIEILPWAEQAGSPRAQIHFVKPNGKSFYDVFFRHDIPLILLDDERVNNYLLYNIRFAVLRDCPQLDDESCKPLFSGYYGITKRPFMERFNEHHSKALSNSGHLLHSIWHSLKAAAIPHYPVVQIAAHAETLKEIYALEEEAVAKVSLNPRGLNAIPGGEAGIKMLHELALLKNLKVGIVERDSAVERLHSVNPSGSPCAHYRKGHMRKLSSGKLAYVKPCWVNLSTEVK